VPNHIVEQFHFHETNKQFTVGNPELESIKPFIKCDFLLHLNFCMGSTSPGPSILDVMFLVPYLALSFSAGCDFVTELDLTFVMKVVKLEIFRFQVLIACRFPTMIANVRHRVLPSFPLFNAVSLEMVPELVSFSWKNWSQ
jgi:hypothetical protein